MANLSLILVYGGLALIALSAYAGTNTAAIGGWAFVIGGIIAFGGIATELCKHYWPRK
jgi:hypothetical protein